MPLIPYIFHLLFVLLFLFLLRSLLLGGDRSTKKEEEMQRIYQKHRKLDFLRTRDIIEEVLKESSELPTGQRKTDREKAHQVCIRLFGVQMSLEGEGSGPNKCQLVD